MNSRGGASAPPLFFDGGRELVDGSITRGRGFRRFGSYRTSSRTIRLPRVRCLDFKRTCSRRALFDHLRPSRAPSSSLGSSPASPRAPAIDRSPARSAAARPVARLADRLGRYGILLHARCNAHLPALAEAVLHGGRKLVDRRAGRGSSGSVEAVGVSESDSNQAAWRRSSGGRAGVQRFR